ncbi:hypothetical protein Tco_0909835 [Tanacetum coccineum]|uniref:Reverse transcriptase domain-containing protein n=1 Tax=Tanacetum coccineum TaxID=301880 RepID=A0ABQ5CSE5_9ASTR
MPKPLTPDHENNHPYQALPNPYIKDTATSPQVVSHPPFPISPINSHVTHTHAPPQSDNQTPYIKDIPISPQAVSHPPLLISPINSHVAHTQAPPQSDNQTKHTPPLSQSRESLVDDINQLQDISNLLAMHLSQQQKDIPSSPYSPNLPHTLNINQLETHVGWPKDVLDGNKFRVMIVIMCQNRSGEQTRVFGWKPVLTMRQFGFPYMSRVKRVTYGYPWHELEGKRFGIQQNEIKVRKSGWIDHRQLANSLIPLSRGSFDVNVGMDWLSKRKFVIVCHEKVVRIPLKGDEILRVYGEHTLGAAKALMNAKVDEPRISDIPVVRDFIDVYPEDLLGLPPQRQVEFHIDLVPGATLVAKSPYLLAPLEMQELSEQLQELEDKGFI